MAQSQVILNLFLLGLRLQSLEIFAQRLLDDGLRHEVGEVLDIRLPVPGQPVHKIFLDDREKYVDTSLSSVSCRMSILLTCLASAGIRIILLT